MKAGRTGYLYYGHSLAVTLFSIVFTTIIEHGIGLKDFYGLLKNTFIFEVKNESF